MSDSKKNLLYAAIGGVAIVGCALVYHIISNSEGAQQQDGLIDEIAALGEPKRDQNGLLSFHYYKELFLIVNKYVKARNAASKVEMVADRRQALKDGDMNRYKQIVQDIIQQEERGFQDIMQEAMDYIGLSEAEFMQVHQTYSQHPAFQQTMMQQQFKTAKPPTISRQDSK